MSKTTRPELDARPRSVETGEVGKRDDRTDVLNHLAVYLGLPKVAVNEFVVCRDPRIPLAELWHSMNPKSEGDFQRFYSSEVGYYLWDLAAFNTQPSYWAGKVAPALEMLEIHARPGPGRAGGTGKGKVVDFGGGIGSLAIALAQKGVEVVFVELPSPQRRFAEWRFERLHLTPPHCGARISVVSSLQEVDGADNVVAIDVMEHIHPDELPRVCHEFARIVLPDSGGEGVSLTVNQDTEGELKMESLGYAPPPSRSGKVLAITEFGKSLEWPMHQDTRQLFEDSMRREGFYETNGRGTWSK